MQSVLLKKKVKLTVFYHTICSANDFNGEKTELAVPALSVHYLHTAIDNHYRMFLNFLRARVCLESPWCPSGCTWHTVLQAGIRKLDSTVGFLCFLKN